MLRLAKDVDIDIAHRLCKEFFSNTQYGSMVLSEENTRALVLSFLKSPNTDSVCILWEGEEDNFGILAGQLQHIPFINRKVAIECLWWVDPGIRGGPAGKELLNAFEYWAKLQGADFLQMMSMPDRTGKALGRFYKQRGYNLTELTYTKEL